MPNSRNTQQQQQHIEETSTSAVHHFPKRPSAGDYFYFGESLEWRVERGVALIAFNASHMFPYHKLTNFPRMP
jgi:hypothetical protein